MSLTRISYSGSKLHLSRGSDVYGEELCDVELAVIDGEWKKMPKHQLKNPQAAFGGSTSDPSAQL